MDEEGQALHRAFSKGDGGWTGTPDWASIDDNAKQRWAVTERHARKALGAPNYEPPPEPVQSELL